MGVVLGIDAAWTATRPSGVALVADDGDGWTLRAVAPSYAAFLAAADDAPPSGTPSGAAPDVPALLAAAARIAGRPVDLVAIDMPLARTPIVARRPSDDAIARAFGRWHCATHSPSADRPGALSDRLRAELAVAGYPLRTDGAARGGLIEVYPHPALVILAGETRRLPYKAGNSARYWPGVPLAERRIRLRAQWQRIAALLETRIAGVADRLPPLAADATGAACKAHEDMLDAIVCAWIGASALRGDAQPYGDADSAIWVPRPLSAV